MNTPEKNAQIAKEFQRNLTALIDNGVSAGVSLVAMIFACGDQEYRLRRLREQIEADNLARELAANAPRVVPANGREIHFETAK